MFWDKKQPPEDSYSAREKYWSSKFLNVRFTTTDVTAPYAIKFKREVAITMIWLQAGPNAICWGDSQGGAATNTATEKNSLVFEREYNPLFVTETNQPGGWMILSSITIPIYFEQQPYRCRTFYMRASGAGVQTNFQITYI